jgi:serine phosphatase RsbU (regulator of sigma subunit)/ligand-binding sensor domain-containing protein
MKHQGRIYRTVSVPTLLLCILLTITFTVTRAAAKDRPNIRFEELSLEEGLSQTIVECIAQDQRGFMWFGTEDGLNRYDGYIFTVLRHDPENPNSLVYNHILSLLVDGAGYIWIGTFDSGLDRFDPYSENFTHYRFDPENPESLSNDHVISIFEDSSGDLWIGTMLGLNRLDRETGTFTRYINDPDDPHSIGHNTARVIYEDRSGILWIGTEGGGLNRYDRDKDRFIRYTTDPGDPSTISHNSIRAIQEDVSGVLWIGTVGGGLNALDKDRNFFTRYRHDPDDRSSLSHDQVYAIHEDRTGTLWIGTNGGGLNRLDRRTQTFSSYVNDPSDPSSISYNEIYDIFEDHSGVIWLGTYGGGINKFDSKRKKFELYRPRLGDPNSLNQPIVWTTFEEEDTGILWIGTHGGGLNRLDRRKNRWTHYRNDPDDPRSLTADIVRVVYEDTRGILWVATHGGGLCILDRETGTFSAFRHDPDDPSSISSDQLRSIYEDRSGTLWFGTNGGGLNRMNRTAGTFTRYLHDPDDIESISNDYVRVIYEDRDGDFWIGTQGGGLERMDRESGSFTHYKNDPADTSSVSSDYVFSILEDYAGILWIGTWGGGLNRFDKKAGIFSRYTVEDGLASNSVYGGLMDEQGNIWISTNNGISRFNPRTETFKNYTVDDGLQGNEFNGNSFFKSTSGEMFFGGTYGLTTFYPHEIKDNPHVPPVVITSFSKFNKEVKFDKPLSDIGELVLSHNDYVFSFEFAALDYSAPSKNQYAYRMKGLDDDWVPTGSNKRFAYYTTLPSGRYEFMVKGSNNDGLWNEEGTSVKIRITPPFHQTWWFRSVVFLAAVLLIRFWYGRRMRNTRITAELNAAHDAQMSIMPHTDPKIEGLDISGICIPANEVGGDFYDYISMNMNKERFGIVIGDVAGKAMKAAMVAVMSSGMVFSKADEDLPTDQIATHLNRAIYYKTDEIIYTALCLGFIDVTTKEFSFTLAGFCPPLLKSGNTLQRLDGIGPRFPLGILEDVVYERRTIKLVPGDVLILYTDGVTEARDNAKEFYGHEGLEELVGKMDSNRFTARIIKDAIVEDVKKFSGGAPQTDDMTVIVVKIE